MDLISVIMSTFSEPLAWVQESLNSVIYQSYNNIEILVVIDNPENHQVVDYLRMESKKYTNVHLIENKKNIGLVKSLNRALSMCRGKYVARMDADDISLPKRFEHQLKFMTSNHYDILGTGFCDFIDGDKSAPRYNPKSSSACYRILKYRNCTLHPSWLVKKDVYESLGGYREIRACEDYDFLVRAAINNYSIGNIPEVLVLYRNNPRSISHQNLGKQKAIMEYIAQSYRKGKVLSMEEYRSFCDSEEINNYATRIIEYYNAEDNLKKIYGIERIVKFAKIMMQSRFYRREKIRNQYIKTITKIDSVQL